MRPMELLRENQVRALPGELAHAAFNAWPHQSMQRPALRTWASITPRMEYQVPTACSPVPPLLPQMLSAKHSQAESKVSELQEELREARRELHTRDRQLESSKRLLLSEYHAASPPRRPTLVPSHAIRDVGAGTDQQQSKQSHWSDAEERLKASEHANHQLSQEVQVLRRALKLQEGMAPGGSLDSQSRLLLQLSKSHEESSSLAVQLAEGQRQQQDLQERLARSGEQVHRLEQVGANQQAHSHPPLCQTTGPCLSFLP